MKKNYLMLVALTLAALPGFAQEKEAKEEKPFNKWSIDFGVGVTKPLNNLDAGYYTATPDFWAAELGARYMINELFGVKGGFYYNRFKAKDSSLDFETGQYRLNIEGVMNLGRMMRFENWTRRLNLLAHAGIGAGLIDYDLNDDDDWVGSGIAGLTGQIKLSNRVSLNIDGNFVANGRQQMSFNGNGPGNSHNFGLMLNGTVGLSINLGKHKQHADWYVRTIEANKALETKIAKIEDKVDKAAKADDLNALRKDVDNLSRRVDAMGNKQGTAPASYDDFMKKLITDGYIDIYFDFDKSSIDASAFAVLGFVKRFMEQNPRVSMEVSGYADEKGPEEHNRKLSQRRAGAAVQVLTEGGIDGSRLNAVGKGTDSRYDKNAVYGSRFARRVSFTVK